MPLNTQMYQTATTKIHFPFQQQQHQQQQQQHHHQHQQQQQQQQHYQFQDLSWNQHLQHVQPIQQIQHHLYNTAEPIANPIHRLNNNQHIPTSSSSSSSSPTSSPSSSPSNSTYTSTITTPVINNNYQFNELEKLEIKNKLKTSITNHYHSKKNLYNNNSNNSNNSNNINTTTKKINKIKSSAANRRKNNRKLISPLFYQPADPSIDISHFTQEDIIILKNLLPLAEIHKWKFISNKLSKQRSKKLNAEYCMNKFHQMYHLPFNPKNSLLHTNYLLKLDNKSNIDGVGNGDGENFEGMVGSSIPYIVSKEGWNYLD